MARSANELDLFNMEKNVKWQPSAIHKPPIFQRRRSFRDIQDVISKVNPEIVKSVISNVSVPSTPKETQTKSIISQLPVCDPTLGLGLSFGLEDKAETASMTIFYNGMVAVFDVSPHKAKDILKLAHESVLSKPAESSESHSCDQDKNLVESLYGDLPLARRKSLKRFLEKRKERLAMVSPYDYPKHQLVFHPLPDRSSFIQRKIYSSGR